MKCPKCRAEGFGLSEYNKRVNKAKPYTAIMQCQKCSARARAAQIEKFL